MATGPNPSARFAIVILELPGGAPWSDDLKEVTTLAWKSFFNRDSVRLAWDFPLKIGGQEIAARFERRSGGRDNSDRDSLVFVKKSGVGAGRCAFTLFTDNKDFLKIPTGDSPGSPLNSEVLDMLALVAFE